MVTTRLCRELAIEHPILSAPLGGGMAGPELAAAVSEAGGLGLLGMGGVPASVIREEIRDTRRRTSKPFGAGLLLPLLEGGEVDACIEERVSVLLFFWGDVAPHVGWIWLGRKARRDIRLNVLRRSQRPTKG